MTYRVLSLFAGIGGFDLGLERTGGFKTVAFCEFDKKAQLVLAKHWPGVPIYDDVRTLTGERLAADGVAVDCIVGGFPCQDISTAGTGAGIEGERSGLWADYARLIGELRPRNVIVENVSALLGRGLDRVLGDLASLGYDADWHCIPASRVGAPHRRDRIWIVAYPASCLRWALAGSMGSSSGACRREKARGPLQEGLRHPRDGGLATGGATLAHAISLGQSGSGQLGDDGGTDTLADAGFVNVKRFISRIADAQERQEQGQRPLGSCRDGDGWWAVEPEVGRVAHGIPGRVDRLKQLGNAVVPQVVELIGRAILAAEAA